MKKMRSALLLAATAATMATTSEARDLLAIRVGKAETVSHGTIEHAVILVDDGKIVSVGQDLEVERGIPVLDRPDWVAMPGLVNCYSRIGMDSAGESSSNPHLLASSELYGRQDVWQDVLDAGITTLGLYPPGTGIPGQAVAVRPSGEDADDMVLRDKAYLKVLLRAQSSSKKMVTEGFEKADAHLEKEKKAREKYDAEVEKREKAKKKSSKKKDDDEKAKEEEPKKEAELAPYEAPVPDEKVAPFLELRDGTLTALFSIRKAADFLHLLDSLGDEEIQWDLRVPLRSESDMTEVAEKLVEAGCRIVLEPRTTYRPTTRRDRNLPQEMHSAGVPVVLIPNGDSLTHQQRWLHDVGNIVKFGMDRDAALRAVTLEAAGVLGLQDRLGSIEPGKDANLIFFDGDPLEPTSVLTAVMLEGRFAAGEENL